MRSKSQRIGRNTICAAVRQNRPIGIFFWKLALPVLLTLSDLPGGVLALTDTTQRRRGFWLGVFGNFSHRTFVSRYKWNRFSCAVSPSTYRITYHIITTIS